MSKIKHEKTVRRVNRAILRKKLLEIACDYYDDATEATNKYFDSESASRSFENLVACETIVKLLEHDDCGSIGGFDLGRGQPEKVKQKVLGRFTLLQRLTWLKSIPIEKV